ncbi:otolith matrix protein OMM-64 isoform X1 [Diabrotica virgifera virgifera]|uniref:Sarcalumenin n=1 Tax=Diabrotica virgifera virgifera TaxID=50390 RepID=A0ABM5L9K5_DIAVI|nr:otolith matrix protein OMM-64 isoform X1 [Diabrotica virgifera virgifera]
MEVYRRSSGLVLLLGLFLLATTLQGVQGEVESEGPSESECRPYIEKALKELEAGEVPAGSSAEDGDGDSKEDIPTVEITDDSAHQEGDGEKDDTNEAGQDQDSNENVQTVSEKIEPEVRPTVIQKISSFFQKVFQRTPSKKEEAANESKQSEDKQDDASQEQQDEASVNDADRKDAEEDEQKEDSKEDDTKTDETASAEDDGKDEASNEGDDEKADEKASEDEESKEQQADDNVSEDGESEEPQAESEEEKADTDDSKEEAEAQQNADDSTEDDGAQQDESKEEQAQQDDKSEEHGDSLEERIEAEIIEHLTQSQNQDDGSKEDEPAAQVEDQKESIEDQAQSDEEQAQSEEEQPTNTEDTQDTKEDDSKEDDGKDGDSKEDEKNDPEDDKEASKEVTKDETDDDSKEDEHERHKRSIDDAQDDGIESKEEEATLKEDASKEDSKEDEAATKEEVDDKQQEEVEEVAESKEDDVDSKEGTTEDADKSDEKVEPQSDENTEDNKQESAENKDDDQKDGDSKEDDTKSTEQDDKDDKDDDVKGDSREENADDKSVEAEKDGDESRENDSTDDNKSGEDGAPVEELSLDTEIPSDLRPRDHVEQLLKLDEQSSDTETIINRVSEITLRDLKKLYENAIKPLEVLYKYRDLSNRHFGDSEIFSKPLILFMGPWSGGKSSIINYLTNNEYNETSLRTGAEPSPAYFNILMYGEEPEVIDGSELAADFTFSGLQKFGQGLEERLRGVKLPSKLLEKVNIVEIPGILEVRKQVSRVFPFNDACQWFIDRGDIIFLVYDPSKLDVGPETEAILDQLKGREHQTRIILNKADRVKPEELLRVQGALIWNISPLMSSPQPPIMYTTSLWSRPYEPWAPVRLLQAQERAFLRDLRGAVDKRIENKIASARRFAVRVRNHAKMVDCYLTTYYNHKSVFGNRKQVADAIIEHPQDYHIYEGLSTLTNISRYDLPDPDVYKDFFKLNPLYEFQQLSATCTYFRGCPINRLDIAIAYDLPELLGTHRKRVESALTEEKSGSKQQTSTTPGS